MEQIKSQINRTFAYFKMQFLNFTILNSCTFKTEKIQSTERHTITGNTIAQGAGKVVGES